MYSKYKEIGDPLRAWSETSAWWTNTCWNIYLVIRNWWLFCWYTY